jgi:hypothetical protein
MRIRGLERSREWNEIDNMEGGGGVGEVYGDLTLIILEMPNSKLPFAQYSVPMTAGTEVEGEVWKESQLGKAI